MPVGIVMSIQQPSSRTDRSAERKTDRTKERKLDRQRDRRTDRQAGRQADRRTHEAKTQHRSVQYGSFSQK